MTQNNCNNTIPSRINLTNPCSPCNACSQCNRCACECTCDLPDYCTDGCVLIIPSSCATYNGSPITVGEQTITTGMNMTEVIEILAGITPPSGEGFRTFSVESDDSNSDIDLNNSINALADRVTMTEERLGTEDINLQSQIDNKLSLSNLEITSNDLTSTISTNHIELGINYTNFLTNFVNFIKENNTNTSIFGQLFSYINNPSNFINAPYQISAIPSITTILIEWTNINEASTYIVYKRIYATGNFESVGTTPSLGMTISGLTQNTLYEFYVVSVSASGNQSLPSTIITSKTLSINP